MPRPHFLPCPPALRRRAWLALPAAALCPRSAPARDAAPLIAAAADLHFALEEIAARFQEASGWALRLSFGSSGNLARQIEQGAPFELFLSADETFVFRLLAGGHVRDEGVLYATGRIVLFAPPASPIDAEQGLAGLLAALEAGRVRRFAIAQPEHAPYGRAAEQALRAVGLWERLAPHLVLAENVAQAAQFALAGGSQGGIVAYALVLSPALRGRGRFSLIPEALHAPLRQRMVLTRRAGPVAEAFYAHLQSPAARSILRRHGFSLPED
ncbi:MAG: molybdate ABC transporter substrate-binding protein [Rhodovarius sp.]|nr:molybdate ABC transporter substrate-binding protein [Rhodovarius sp.]